MSSRSTFYGFIAALMATVASGLVYSSARSRLAAFRDIGEGTAQDTRSVVLTTDLSFLILIVTGVLTVMLFLWFIVLKQRSAKQVSA